MHIREMRIYYEDTDFSGLVYHANYLKFLERARTEYLRDQGIAQTQLFKDKGVSFVVSHMDIAFKRPARMDDIIQVHTQKVKSSGVRMILHQAIMRDDSLLIEANVTLALIDKHQKVRRLSDLAL